MKKYNYIIGHLNPNDVMNTWSSFGEVQYGTTEMAEEHLRHIIEVTDQHQWKIFWITDGVKYV